jgi:type IV pilus assembly protein PilV
MAAGQLQSLKYATNSFDYTLALLQANNAVERTWDNLCQLQNDPTVFNANKPSAQFDKYDIEFKNGFDNDNFLVSVSWTDDRIDGDDSVLIEASFPDISGVCQ